MGSIKPLAIGNFLKNARQSLLKNLSSPALANLKFVIGNQSGDLDSICSAISYAYYSHIYNVTKQKCEAETVTSIPVLNFHRDELALRKDCAWLFFEKLKHINFEDLVFIDELNDIETVNKTKINIVLVDHNNPEKFIRRELKSEFQVVSIIDHHADEKTVVEGVSPRIIQTCGSCTTLVANYWINEMNLLSVEHDVNKLVELGEVITLGCSALLIDTDELKFKAVALDHLIYDNYYTKYNDVAEAANEQKIDFDTLFRVLREKKNYINDLTVGQILQKDFKSYDLVRKNENGKIYSTGISSTVKPFDWMINRDGEKQVLNAIETFRDTLGLDICIVMTSYTDKSTQKFSRELIVWLKDASFDFFITDLTNSTLDLKRLDSRTNARFAKFLQQNTNASRKQVAPILKNIVENS